MNPLDRKGQPIKVGDKVVVRDWFPPDIPKYIVGCRADVLGITRRGKIVIAATGAETGTRTVWSRYVQKATT